MARSKTPSFITELPLRTSPPQEKALLKRFEAARHVYNACLGEALNRLALLRQSKAYQAARAMPKGKERTKAFRDAEAAVGFREYDLNSWSKQFNHSWLDEHLGSRTVKALTQRAYLAARRWQLRIGLKGKPGKGRPHFKRRGEMTCVDSITNLQGLRWLDGVVVWKGLTLEPIIDENPVIEHGLSSRVKHVRMVRKLEHGRNRFYVQLVCEGMPFQRVALGEGRAGLDIGPSTVAVVGHADAFLQVFCGELGSIRGEVRRLQRHLDRQRRANNPANYNEDGTVKKGVKRWITSNRQRRTTALLAEAQRKQAAYRKSLHGQLVNRILAMGDQFKLEKLSYVAFQKQWGRSVRDRAPGIFVELLRRNVEAGNGTLEEFSPYSTRLSQVCHNCGTVEKKPLSQRWHDCPCGILAQRDLYSAFLAACVEDGSLNAGRANEAWPDAGPLLQAALSNVQPTNAGVLPQSLGIGRGQSRSPAKASAKMVDDQDVVPERGELGKGHRDAGVP